MGGKKKTTVGYHYAMGMHFVLCHGPVDKLIEIRAGKRTAWNEGLTASGALTFAKPQLFGGEEREGGVSGPGYLLMGDAAQTLPTDISTKMSGLQAAFRGLTSLYFNGRFSANNPYVKPWEFRVRRIIKGWSINGEEAEAWYPEAAAVPVAGTPAAKGILFAMDVSGSMATTVAPGVTRLDVLKDAVNLALDALELDIAADIRVDLRITRWSATAESFTRYDADAGDIADAKAYVNASAIAGGTNFDAPMGPAVDFFTELNTLGITSNARQLFFVTDGEPSPIESVDAAVVTAADLINRTGDFTVVAGTAVDIFGINIALADTQYTEQIDNTPADGVPVIDDNNVEDLADALTQPDGGTIFGMNPAHIIYQALVDDRLTLAFGTAQINEASFTAAADTFFAEGLGLCLEWNQQAPIGEFIDQVLEHCRAILYVDPEDGLFNLKPLRADYDPDTLTVFGEDEIIAYESFAGSSADELASTVQVVYRNVETAEDETITLQNLGVLQQQFGAPTETVQLPGIPTAVLAGRAAQSVLDEKSLPLKKHRVRLTRAASRLKPGDVIKLTWPKLGISESVVRVLAVNRGTLRNGAVVIEAVDDVYGFPLTTYLAVQPIGYEEFDPAPVPITEQSVIELPYWTAALYEGTAFANGVDVDSGYLAPLAARNAANAQAYRIWSRISPADYEDQDLGNFVPYAVLDGAIDEQATTLTLSAEIDLDQVEIGDLAIIGDGRLAEWVLVTGITISPASIEVSRAVLDTTPRAHTAGSTVFFADGFASQDSTERATGQVVDFKLATISTGGELEIAFATEISGETDQRIARPYPPGNVLVNGEAWPVDVTGALTITWSHRDRQQQTAYVVEQTEGDIGPEAGTTYNAYAYDDATDTLIDSDTGITGTSWTPSIGDNYTLRIEIEAERGGLVSWQRQVRVFTYGTAVLALNYSDELLSGDLVLEGDAQDGNDKLALEGDF